MNANLPTQKITSRLLLGLVGIVLVICLSINYSYSLGHTPIPASPFYSYESAGLITIDEEFEDSSNEYANKFSCEVEFGLTGNPRLQGLLRKQDYHIDPILRSEGISNPNIYFGVSACKMLNNHTALGGQYIYKNAVFAFGSKVNIGDTLHSESDFLRLGMYRHQLSTLIKFGHLKILRFEIGPSIVFARINATTGFNRDTQVTDRFAFGLQTAVALMIPPIKIPVDLGEPIKIDIGLLKISQSLFHSVPIGPFDTGEQTFHRRTINLSELNVGFSIQVRI